MLLVAAAFTNEMYAIHLYNKFSWIALLLIEVHMRDMVIRKQHEADLEADGGWKERELKAATAAAGAPAALTALQRAKAPSFALGSPVSNANWEYKPNTNNTTSLRRGTGQKCKIYVFVFPIEATSIVIVAAAFKLETFLALKQNSR